MARGESREVWQQRIEEWQNSGKTARTWCNEQGVQLASFYQWRKRFSQKAFAPDAFIEIKENKSAKIEIEYHGFRIHLVENFDKNTLLRCLATLRTLTCSP